MADPLKRAICERLDGLLKAAGFPNLPTSDPALIAVFEGIVNTLLDEFPERDVVRLCEEIDRIGTAIHCYGGEA